MNNILDHLTLAEDYLSKALVELSEVKEFTVTGAKIIKERAKALKEKYQLLCGSLSYSKVMLVETLKDLIMVLGIETNTYEIGEYKIYIPASISYDKNLRIKGGSFNFDYGTPTWRICKELSMASLISFCKQMTDEVEGFLKLYPVKIEEIWKKQSEVNPLINRLRKIFEEIKG